VADGRKYEFNELDVVRWLCYVGFFVSTLALITALSTGGGWIGPIAGVLIFGVPTLKMYTLEAARQQTVRSQAQWRAQHGGDAQQDWDLNATDDPSQPPRKP
jgi:hypothetical protein